MSKTIKQLADEFGVSKTAIRKRFTDEFKEKYVQSTSEGSLRVSDDGCKLIAESFRKRAETSLETKKLSQPKFAETCENSGFQQSIDIQKENIEFLKEQLAIKDEQLRAQQQQLSIKDEQIKAQQQQLVTKDEQIGKLTVAMENTTAALTAAQALHAGTIQERLTVAQDRSEEETVIKNDEPHKRGIFKRIFGKKESSK